MCESDGSANGNESNSAPAFPIGPVAVNTANWALVLGTSPRGEQGYVLGVDPVSRSAAEKVALGRCTSAGVNDCRVVERYNSGVIAIARATDGRLFHGIYPYPKLTSELKQAKQAKRVAEKSILVIVLRDRGRCKLLQVTPSNDWIGFDD